MRKEKFQQKLLVEGKDDLHVIWALCGRCELIENFSVIETEGVENLLTRLPIELKTDIKTVGIVVDADTDLSNRWQSIKSILQKQGFDVPAECPKEGLIFQGQKVKIGVWLMPNNEINGTIEDFIRFLVPENDALLPIVRAHIENIEQQNLQKYAAVHRSKALIGAWLAIQKSPATPMGQAITKRYLDSEVPSCAAFIAWLKALFGC